MSALANQNYKMLQNQKSKIIQNKCEWIKKIGYSKMLLHSVLLRTQNSANENKTRDRWRFHEILALMCSNLYADGFLMDFRRQLLWKELNEFSDSSDENSAN